ncbi:spore protease YyaC [Eubacterium multiforme]|uniref:Sporulation protein YyaC n=1 Tax=Eubacterium multiforme TaxID=83339 RepID=A0ABT9UXS3_9FIRM|nr:spore protease YyaC [Eubacterium multiforme]MDQ0151113.1 putative sporulation protein YyaC [Eubacterium multiforme]
MNNSFSVYGVDINSSIEIGEYLYDILKKINYDREIIFLCIGSDRSTGDALGPLVGNNLKSFKNKRIYIYGSLYNPIHSQNLNNTINKINNNFNNPYIVAIDASLGSLKNVGKIFIQNKPLKPGLALNKDLPPIGDLSITGIVNITTKNFEFVVLQNTRLYLVNSLAQNISNGISHAINKLISNTNILKSIDI